jgi:hypothetical protein
VKTLLFLGSTLTLFPLAGQAQESKQSVAAVSDLHRSKPRLWPTSSRTNRDEDGRATWVMRMPLAVLVIIRSSRIIVGFSNRAAMLKKLG